MAQYDEDREQQYQEKLIQRFQLKDGLNYKYLGKWQYPKDGDCLPDGTKNSPILESRVCAFLKKMGRTDYQIEQVISKLKVAARLGDKKLSSLIACSNDVYDILMGGIKAKPSVDENEEDVMLFDFENIENNDFAFAEEVSFVDPLTGLNKRPDIVVYVNGIALAIIELKRSLVNYEEGIKQHLSNEVDFIPSFFTTTQFTISSNDGVEFRYGTIGTPLQFWCKWKKDSNQTGIELSEKESYDMFFDHENFMFFLRYGVLNDGGKKKVLRPHQLYAIKAAGKRMLTKSSGVIWHSQGSGKSLTMVALANYIRRNNSNPRVVVITDRTELDIQLAGTFTKGGNNIHQARSGADLLETLNNGDEWLISTLIHKFGARGTNDQEIDESGTKIRLDQYLNELKAIIVSRYPGGFSVKGDNIFVFVDECHRTQGGLLHQAMREIMGKEVMLIGFTGTPLLKKDKKNQYNDFIKLSEVTFGPYIHKYLHKQAVEDKVIVDLQYEYRNVEQQITSKEKLDQKFEALTFGKDLNEEQKEQLKERWATLERMYSTKERIERIGNSILDDYQFGLLRHDWCNAMLVAGSIYQAYRYYQFFCNDTPLAGHTAVVTSYDPLDSDLANDISDPNSGPTETKFKYEQAKKSFAESGIERCNAEKYEAWAKNLFIYQPAQMKLLIVVNKLLTGFDAPCATLLYMDSDLRDHTLFQAICRVNRLGEDVKDEEGNVVTPTHKDFGLIVDFKNLFDSIEDAVSTFNDAKGEGFSGMDEEDIEDLLVDAVTKNMFRLRAAKEAYLSLKATWEAKGLLDSEALAEYYTTDYPCDPAKERRVVLYAITGKLVAAFNNMTDYFSKVEGITEDEVKDYERLAKEAGTINRKVKQKSGDDFDPKNLDPDMRRLLDQHVKASDAETLIQQSADFSFLDLISESTDIEAATEEAIRQAGGNAKGAAEVIEGKVRRVNTDWNSGDASEYQRFSEKLQKILDKLKSKQATAQETIKALIQQIKEMKRGTDVPDALNTERRYCRALWNNRAEWCAETEQDAIIEQINKIDTFIYQNAGRGYQDPDSNAAWDLRDDLSSVFGIDQERVMRIYQIVIQNQ